MFYFIPAWYQGATDWQSMIGPWYYEQPFFDDTISQLRMFEQAGQVSQLLVLNPTPQLRYMAHRHGLLEVSMWSVFDQIQGITPCEQRFFDYKDLQWPRGSEFIPSPFLVLVRLERRVIGRIEFGSDGQVLWIDQFTDETISVRHYLDDRGFVSSCLYYQDGMPHHQDYLNRLGQWQIRHYLVAGQESVEVHPAQQHRFAKPIYAGLDELIEEVLGAYLASQDPDGALFVASHPLHNPLLQRVKGERAMILSYYQDRYPMDHPEVLQADMAASDLVLADNLALIQHLQGLTSQEVMHLSPFDTRLMLGKSQRIKELVVHFILDGISAEQACASLNLLARVMEDKEDIHLSLVTYSKDFVQQNHWRQLVGEWLETREEAYFFLEEEQEVSYEVLEEEPPVSRVSFGVLQSERDILKALEKTRVIVDLAEPPHLYTQIAGISIGIPQINACWTEFVEHKKNGYLLSTVDDLQVALDYYLTGLRHWNEALVYSVQKMTDYTSGQLVHKLLSKMR